MKKNKNGKIVFINSVAGLSPYPHSSAYVASKYGLRGFSASIREELRKYNIKSMNVINLIQEETCKEFPKFKKFIKSITSEIN